MKFEKGHFTKAVDSISQASESFAAGQSLASKLKKDDLKGVFILSDGLNANGSELIRGFNSIIDTKQIITSGCLAGDSGDFKRTWLINERRTSSGIIIALGFYGDVICAQGSKGGWDQFGIERRISKSEGNIVFEIDDKPALDLYEEYLGEKSKELPASGLLFPMQIRSEKNYNQPLIRTLLGIDRIKKSLTFAGDMPLGRVVQLMKANFERLVQGAADAANVMNSMMIKKIKDQNNTSDIVTIVVSCVGRRLVLGQRTDEELEAIQNESKFASNMIGIYSYGELASYEPGAECELHNQSMTIFTITEAA
ncbi:MAG: FIST C-terminal domain-containing protein [Proteobacteria bacterium]|nr:FIST C-terminal domain-containing protein [Pseudomonadota bacterium]